MTYTDCWISTVDDDDFKALIAEQRKLDARRAHPINLLPRLPAGSHYWLPVVKEYATARDQSIRYSDPLSIEVPLSRSRLLEFLDATYGPDPDAAVRRLRNHIRRFFQC